MIPSVAVDAPLDQAMRLVSDARAGLLPSPSVKTFFDPATFTASHVVRDPTSSACAIIDSALDFDMAAGRTSTSSASALVDYVRAERLQVQWLLETHAHADHLSAAPWLQEQVGGALAIGEHITAVQETFGKLFNAGTAFKRDGSQFDHLFADGASFRIGNLQAMSLHVPGHTPACLAYVIGDAVFPGDTLFMPDYGTARCDFPGGSAPVVSLDPAPAVPARRRPRIPVPRLQSHRPGPFRMGNYHRCRKGNKHACARGRERSHVCGTAGGS